MRAAGALLPDTLEMAWNRVPGALVAATDAAGLWWWRRSSSRRCCRASPCSAYC